MLCESIKEEELKNLRGEYFANIKYDGERCISMVGEGEGIILINRRGNIINNHFKQIVTELTELKNVCKDIILDGEIISYDDDFTKLQSQALSKTDKGIVCYYMVFDILRLNRQDLTNKPLKERMAILEEILKKLSDYRVYSKGKHTELNSNTPPFLRMVEYKPIKEMLEQARKEGREGIIIKDMNSRYESRRSKSWLKLKFFQTTTLILQSYTENPKGIRCEDTYGNAVQIAGQKGLKIQEMLNKYGKVGIIVQYLEKTKEGRLRFPSFVSIDNHLF